MNLEIEGVESHAGARKDKGLSAALEMSHKIIALEGLNDAELGNTVNVGIARAGTASNTVPGFAKIEIDYRFKDPDAGEALESAIIEICDRKDTENASCGLVPVSRRELGPSARPMVRDEAVERMARRIQGYGRELGLELEEEFRGGGSDGNVSSAAGCPTVDGLGTVGGRIHSGEEWMLRRSLVDRACLLALTMMRFHEL